MDQQQDAIIKAKTEWERKRRESLTGGMALAAATRRGWLKYRGVMNQWSLRYYVLLAPSLIYFKDEADVEKEAAMGIVYLRGCTVAERQSKKEGYCFKIEHAAKHNIYGSRGLRGEALASALIPGGSHECILRVPSRAEGAEWVRAIQEAIEFADVSARRASLDPPQSPGMLAAPPPVLGASAAGGAEHSESSVPLAMPFSSTLSVGSFSVSSIPPHPSSAPPVPPQQVAAQPQPQQPQAPQQPQQQPQAQQQQKVPTPTPAVASEAAGRSARSHKHSSPPSPASDVPTEELVLDPRPSRYVPETPRPEMKRDAFEEGKSILLGLMKQLRPGIDLSRVVLPTHILEPRSFLEKTCDYFAHIELLSAAVRKPDPVSRLVGILRWYMSGYYIMPKTPKKPYNPILGETLRCMWDHGPLPEDPSVHSRSFLVCEQVSHHPPVSAFFGCNRADGWVINGSILFKSKFWGTSAGSLLNGFATIYLPFVDEEYTITFPSAIAKGFIVGPLTMELFDTIVVECKKTECCATVEFKTKGLLGGEYNLISGDVTQGKNTLFHVSGRYDREIFLQAAVKGSEPESFWKVTPDLASKRLRRWVIPYDEQDSFESEKLWHPVTVALIEGDQETATDHKTMLERNQRESAKHRAEMGVQWVTRYFDQDRALNTWTYKWMNTRPFDRRIEAGEYESGGRIYSIMRAGLVVPPGASIPNAARMRKGSTSSGITASSGSSEDDDDDDTLVEPGDDIILVSNVQTAAAPQGAVPAAAEVTSLQDVLQRQREAISSLAEAVRGVERKQAQLTEAMRAMASAPVREAPAQRGSDTTIVAMLAALAAMLAYLVFSISGRLKSLESK